MATDSLLSALTKLNWRPQAMVVAEVKTCLLPRKPRRKTRDKYWEIKLQSALNRGAYSAVNFRVWDKRDMGYKVGDGVIALFDNGWGMGTIRAVVNQTEKIYFSYTDDRSKYGHLVQDFLPTSLEV